MQMTLLRPSCRGSRSYARACCAPGTGTGRQMTLTEKMEVDKDGNRRRGVACAGRRTVKWEGISLSRVAGEGWPAACCGHFMPLLQVAEAVPWAFVAEKHSCCPSCMQGQPLGPIPAHPPDHAVAQGAQEVGYRWMPIWGMPCTAGSMRIVCIGRPASSAFVRHMHVTERLATCSHACLACQPAPPPHITPCLARDILDSGLVNGFNLHK